MHSARTRSQEEPQTERPDSALEKVRAHLQDRLRGKEEVIERSMAVFLARGHLLLEGQPGTGKTSLAKALAESFGGSFRRVQMTSDLLPSDVVGMLRLVPGKQEFEFRPGPIFSNFLLADELNRTSPKTQSALLEAMAEGTVTVDGVSHPLPDPFFVVATQNPLESHGVYPLAESQLDRFMLKLNIGSPQKDDELGIYRRIAGENPNDSQEAGRSGARKILSIEESRALCERAARVFVEASVLEYAADLVRATRATSGVEHGVSVRGGLQLIACAKALALIRGRKFVSPQEVIDLAVPALAHRLTLAGGHSDPVAQERVIRQILDQVRAPR